MIDLRPICCTYFSDIKVIIDQISVSYPVFSFMYRSFTVIVPCHLFFLQSTPLHLAAGYNRTRIVQLLLQHGADVHAKDKGYNSI